MVQIICPGKNLDLYLVYVTDKRNFELLGSEPSEREVKMYARTKRKMSDWQADLLWEQTLAAYNERQQIALELYQYVEGNNYVFGSPVINTLELIRGDICAALREHVESCHGEEGCLDRYNGILESTVKNWIWNGKNEYHVMVGSETDFNGGMLFTLKEAVDGMMLRLCGRGDLREAA